MNKAKDKDMASSSSSSSSPGEEDIDRSMAEAPEPPGELERRSPVAPTLPQRILGKPKKMDFQKDEKQGQVAAMFGRVLRYEPHVLNDYTTEARAQWTKVHNACFYGDEDLFEAPLLSYEPCKKNGAENPNKLKKLILDLAEYYAKKYKYQKSTYGDEAVFSECEELGRKVYRQRMKAQKNIKDSRSAKNEAKEKDRREKEEAEKFLGAMPRGCGVSPPPGVVMDDNVNEGLEALGIQPSTYSCKCSPFSFGV